MNLENVMGKEYKIKEYKIKKYRIQVNKCGNK